MGCVDGLLLAEVVQNLRLEHQFCKCVGATCLVIASGNLLTFAQFFCLLSL